MSILYPRRRSTPKTGAEPFVQSDRAEGFTLLDFWRWSASDLLSNAARGVLAEFIVAQALGCETGEGVRQEWEPYDLTTPEGTTVEVKSAAYLQSWHQEKLSQIQFSIASARGWSANENKTAAERVYVFALLAHQDKESVDPLELAQWEFYVLPSARLDQHKGGQQSIGLNSLRALAAPVAYAGLRQAVQTVRD